MRGKRDEDTGITAERKAVPEASIAKAPAGQLVDPEEAADRMASGA